MAAGSPTINNSSAGGRFSKLPKDEMRAIAKKGAEASAEAKRKKKQLQLNLQKMLDGKYIVEDEEGKTKKLTGYEILALQAFINATTPSRDQKDWWTLVRDSVGEKPTDKVEVSDTRVVVDIDDSDYEGTDNN